MKKLVLSLAAALVVGAGAMVLTTGGQEAKAFKAVEPLVQGSLLDHAAIEPFCFCVTIANASVCWNPARDCE